MRLDGHDIRRRGCLFIVSGPSGAGKTSICTPVLADFPDIALSVSYTTRKARAGERDGVDYRFIDADRFEKMIADGEFAEWAEVHSNRYGTARADLETALAAGRDLLLDIDVQGAEQLKCAYTEAVAIFLLPPSREALERRLVGRASDDPDSVLIRLSNACREIASLGRYDYVIFNEDLKTAVAALRSVISAERLRVSRIAKPDLDRVVQSFGRNPYKDLGAKKQ